MNSPITTHVLDTASGSPAAGIVVRLEKSEGDQWIFINEGKTNADGRVTDLMTPGKLEMAHYRINFETAAYFAAKSIKGFYPIVRIEFQIEDPSEHYHVPLLLSPYGYSTYRGS